MAQMLTLGAAARLSGISPKVLSKAAREGRLAATRQENWTFQIDPEDLSRYMFLTEIERMGSPPREIGPEPAAAEQRPATARRGGPAERILPFLRRLLPGRAQAA